MLMDYMHNAVGGMSNGGVGYDWPGISAFQKEFLSTHVQAN